MLRKKFIIPAVLLLISAFTFQSCIGSFSLTNKVLQWNRNVSNKFVNELVFFAFWILPVYEVTSIADLLVINSIEFWSGNKPMESNNQIMETEHGNYQIYASQDGYKILTPEGRTMWFIFDKKDQSWSFANNDEEATEFLKFKDNNHVLILITSGEFMDVELTEDGMNGYLSNIYTPLFANK